MNYFPHFCCLLLVLSISACQGKVEKSTVLEADTVLVRSHVRPTESAQESGDSAKAVLERLFAQVLAEDHAAAAKSIAYRSISGEGDFTRPYNYEVADERVQVDKVCAQISVMLHALLQVEYLEFSVEEESEGVWQVWELQFDYADGGNAKATFALLDLNGQLLLGDID